MHEVRTLVVKDPFEGRRGARVAAVELVEIHLATGDLEAPYGEAVVRVGGIVRSRCGDDGLDAERNQLSAQRLNVEFGAAGRVGRKTKRDVEHFHRLCLSC